MVKITYLNSSSEFNKTIDDLDLETKRKMIYAAGMNPTSREVLWETLKENAKKDGNNITDSDLPQIDASYGKKEIRYNVGELTQEIDCQLQRKRDQRRQRIIDEGPSNMLICPIGYCNGL